MKALVYEGPHNMPICDYPMCYPEAGQVKIKVKYCGICGSDLHGYTGASGRKIPDQEGKQRKQDREGANFLIHDAYLPSHSPCDECASRPQQRKAPPRRQGTSE